MGISNRRRGFGMLVASMLVLGLAACNVGGGGPAAKSNAQLLKEATANMKAAKSYHMEMDLALNGQNVKMNGDLDLANNKAKLTASSGGMDVEMVQIGNDSYTSLDGGKTYTKSESSTTELASFTELWTNLKEEDIDKAKDALKDGTPPTETLDGVETKHITGNAKDLGSLSTGGSGTLEGTVDFWVTTDANPTVRQMKIDGTSEGQEVKGTLKWNKINEQFNIEAPPTSLLPEDAPALAGR